MDIKIAQQLDYQKKEASNPSYKISKILPQSNSAVSISATGGNETVFELFAGAINLSRSNLCFTMTPSAITGTDYNWLHMGTLSPFQQIQLYTRSGVMLCDLQNVQNYTKVVWPAEVSHEELRNFDTIGSYDITNTTNHNILGSSSFLQMSNVNVDMSGNPLNPIPYISAEYQDVPYTEMRYSVVSDVNTNTHISPIMQISFPLNLIKNTIFEVDKDILFNEVILCRFVWGPLTKVGWSNDSNIDPTSAPVTALPGPISISNIALYVATEKNPVLVNLLKSQIASGFTIPVPYVNTFSYTSANSTSQSVTLKINRAHGSRLLRIYHAIFDTPETLNEAYNTYVTPTKLVNFYTQIDDQRLQDFNVTTQTYDDWMLMKQQLEGGLVYNSTIYRNFWFWLDTFDEAPENADSKKDTNVIRGLPLDVERVYQFVATTAQSQYNHYDFVITQKMLSISPGGITLQ